MQLSLPKQMSAVRFNGHGGPEVIEFCQVRTPRPAPGEVLIRVAAAGINRPDCLQREGHYPPPKGASPLPGLEVAGTIVALGQGIEEWQVGETTCALLAGGGYAEYCTAPVEQCMRPPKGLSALSAAALPETFLTVWSNVFERAHLRPGEHFLVHGGSSGIGTVAIQLAVAFDAVVWCTVGNADKAALCHHLGATHVMNYREVDFASEVRRLSEGRGVDVVLDMVGGDYTARNLESLAMDGRLVQIAFLHGARSSINLAPIMLKRLHFTGSTLRARSPEEKGALARTLEAKVWPLIEAERVTPVLDRVFPLNEAQHAHAYFESGQHKGKVMLEVNASEAWPTV